MIRSDLFVCDKKSNVEEIEIHRHVARGDPRDPRIPRMEKTKLQKISFLEANCREMSKIVGGFAPAPKTIYSSSLIVIFVASGQFFLKF
jgi:hypothetical protein